MKAVSLEAFETAWISQDLPDVEATEPLVGFQRVEWTDFQAEEPYDVVCLSQSPPFTPPEADALFNSIRERYIDETYFVVG